MLAANTGELQTNPTRDGQLSKPEKAGLEMLTRQIAADQKAPDFRAISVRPGIIDTGMQAYMRTLPREKYANVDMFREFHASGQLVPPDVVAAKIVDRLVLGEVENGRCYSYKEL